MSRVMRLWLAVLGAWVWPVQLRSVLARRSAFRPTSAAWSCRSAFRPTIAAHLLVLLTLLLPRLAPAEDGLGLLFNTEIVRAQLDAARRDAKLPPPPVADVPEPEPSEPEPELPEPVVEAPPPPPQDLVVNGVVRRARGPETVWVNGEATTGGPLLSADAAVSLPSDSGTQVLLEDAEGQAMRLLPGQAVNTASLRPQEAYLTPATDEAAAPTTSPAAKPAGKAPTPDQAVGPGQQDAR